jgi:acyl-CoA thioester hydrolase
MKKKIFVWNERVRIYDTDAQGIVHYSGYYRFFTDAFEQFSRDVLASEFPLISEKVWFVVVESKAVYHKPAHLGDKLSIGVEAEILGKKALKFSFKIHKEESLMCDGYIVQVAVDSKKWKAIEIPKKIVDKIRKL